MVEESKNMEAEMVGSERWWEKTSRRGERGEVLSSQNSFLKSPDH